MRIAKSVAVHALALTVFSAGIWAQNATPFIDILTPPSAAPGSPSLALKITGTGFAASATVNFNGMILKPTSATETQIHVTVPAASLAEAETANVRVFNPDTLPLNGKSNVVYFPIAKARASLPTTRSDITLGGNPSAIVVGDFNEDGIRDMAVGNENGTIAILLGKENGTFSTAPNLTVSNVVALTIGDFNGDGHIDIAATGYAGNGMSGVTILLGKGNGTFRVGSVIPIAAEPIANVLAGDLNGDGKLDLAVMFPRVTGIAILLGRGDGTFAMGTGGYGSPNGPSALGDVNGDGKLDLLFVDRFFGLTILLGNGDGTFSIHPGPQSNFYTSSFVLGDFNGDGLLDLAESAASISNPNGPGTVAIFLGKGDGTFTLKASPTVGDDPGSVVAGDLNGDGKLDLAVVSCGSDTSCTSDSTVTFLLGKGDGTFTALSPAPTVGLQGGALVLADFNRDGRLDVAASNLGSGTVSVLLQAPGSKSAEEQTLDSQ